MIRLLIASTVLPSVVLIRVIAVVLLRAWGLSLANEMLELALEVRAMLVRAKIIHFQI